MHGLLLRVSDEGIGARVKFSHARSGPVGFVVCYPTMINLISSAVLTAVANAAHFFMASPPRCGSLSG